MRNNAIQGTPMTEIKKSDIRGSGSVAFLSERNKFKDLYYKGWPITAIYDNFGGSDTGLSYSQFTRYIGKYIREPMKRNSTQTEQAIYKPEKLNSPVEIKSLEPKHNINVLGSKIRGFRHDPNSGNTRTDLI